MKLLGLFVAKVPWIMIFASAKKAPISFISTALIHSGGYQNVSGNHQLAPTNEVSRLDLPVSSASPISATEEDYLSQTYKGKFIQCAVNGYSNCEIFLCGTLHVTKSSADFVKDVINRLKPEYVVIELCDARIDSLCEPDDQFANVTMQSILQATFADRSIKTFGIGMLVWMQSKAARMLGNKLGGELVAAAKAAHQSGAVLVLGDRLYSVTIQRAFDRLTTLEKAKLGCMLVWEVLTMSLFRLKDYVLKSELDDSFVANEIESFQKYMPSLSDVIIRERDEYLAQTIHALVQTAFSVGSFASSNYNGPFPDKKKGKVVVVIGAGHLKGVQGFLNLGKSSEERMREISSSSVHNATWPGNKYLQVVNTNILFQNER